MKTTLFNDIIKEEGICDMGVFAAGCILFLFPAVSSAQTEGSDL